MSDEAPFAFGGLERVLHERARLGIVTSLAARPEGVRFSDLKRLCDLTDGNLARHVQVLEEAGLVKAERITGKKRLTRFRLTDEGRERFFAYLRALEDALKAADAAARQIDPPAEPARA